MRAIAEHLDHQLDCLPAALAASVEQVIWDVLKVADASPKRVDADEILAHRQHLQVCIEMSAGVDWADFERPPQGVDEVREGG